MNTHIGKMRNVFGEVHPQKFEDIKTSEVSSEGLLVDANSQYLAVCWGVSGGGAVAILDPEKYARVPSDTPLLRGHSGPVVDLKFSPFRNNILATGSEDATVKIWELSEECFTKDLKSEVQTYKGHHKKLTCISFNPTVAEVVASTSMDSSLHVWNLTNSQNIAKLQLTESIFGCDWNYNGSLVGITSKEKLIKIFDPRNNLVTHQTNGYDNIKAQKMLFMGKSDYFLATGFSKNNERQIKLFDLRNVTDPIQTLGIDHQAFSVQPYYDPDSMLLFLPGKGEATVKYYEFMNGNFKKASDFSSSEPSKSSSFVQKRFVNYNKCEIARMVKLTKNSVSYVHFYYPKKVEGFDANLYPDCLAGEPSNTLDKWTKGENVDPVRKPIDTIVQLHGSGMTFEKDEDKSCVSKQNVVVVDDSNLKVIEELKTELSTAYNMIDKLKLENTKLENALELVTSEFELFKQNSANKEVEHQVQEQQTHDEPQA